MILLTSTSDQIILTTTAATIIDVHASYVDLASEVVTPGRANSQITTLSSTVIVQSPAAATVRNLKGLYISNHGSVSCGVSVRHYDGSLYVDLIGVVLLPGENLGYREDGSWVHRDSQGAEYPPAGLGAYNGLTVPFMKTGTAADTIGYWYCTSKDNGFPGAWSPGTPGVSGRATNGTLTADNGCIPINNPSVGANFLTELQMSSSVNHTHLFFDVLWVNSGLGVTTTKAQAITSPPTLPARDTNGESNGEGCMIALLFTAASTNSAVISTTTVSYTNSKGVANRTATLSALQGSQIPVSPAIGTIVWFNLQAGDTGVSSIQSITLGTSLVSGAVSLMICRDIATIGTTIPNVSAQKILGSPGVKLHNGTCILHCILASATTATFYSGELTIMEK